MARYDRATLNLKLAEKKVLAKLVEAARQAGETTKYSDLIRQFNKVNNEVQAIINSRED